MRKTIWKYPFVVADTFSLTMPPGAEVVSVGVQYGKPCLWAIVDSHQEDNEDRHFICHGTGQPVSSEAGKYIGMFMLLEGQFVGHLFERKRKLSRNEEKA